MKLGCLTPISILVIFAVVYSFTLSRHPNWGDSAKLIVFTHNLKFSSDSGYHNLLLIIFYPFTKLPINNLALKINIANMFFSTLTLSLLTTLLLKLQNSIKTSILLTLCLGFSHLFWHLSVITESYILTSFFLVLCVLLLEEYKKNPRVLKLSLAFFLAGLGAQVNLIFAIMFFIMVLFDIKSILTLKTKILIPILAFIFSLLPIIFIIAKELQAGSGFYEVVIENFLQQKYKKSINLYNLLDFKRIIKILVLFFYQFPFLLLLIFIKSLCVPKKLSYPPITIRYLLLFILPIILTIIYTMPKSIYFLIFTSIFFILSISQKLNYYIENISSKIYSLIIFLLILTNISIYWVTPKLAKNFNISSNIPFRDSARYFLTPWKHNEHSSYDFFKYCAQNLPQNSILISDFSVLKAFEYYQISGNKISYELWDIDKKDILEKIKNNIDKKNIYFTDNSADYKILHTNFHTKKTGVLYQITK